MAVATLYVTKDADASKSAYEPNPGSLTGWNSGTATSVNAGWISSCSLTATYHVFVQADFSTIVGATVSAASFNSYTTTIPYSGYVNQTGRPTSSWLEGTGSVPTGYAGTRFTHQPTVNNAYYSLAVTEYAQYWAAGNTNLGMGIGPTVNAAGTIGVFSSRETTGTTQDPYFSVTYNNPPTAPGAFTSPTAGAIFDAVHTVTWGASTDANGDSLQYELDLSTDGGTNWSALSALAANVSRSIDFSGKAATTNAVIRARAHDGSAYGSYTLSPTFTIQHTVAPNVPTAVGRDASSPDTDTTPLLTANVSDANAGQQIKARFQIYQSDGTTLVGSVDSAFRTGNGVVTAEYSTALPVGTYKVQAQSIDDTALSSAYSAQVTIQVTQLVTKDVSLLWNVKQQINKSLTVLWNVAQNGIKDLSILWNTLVSRNKDVTLKWNEYPYWENVPYESSTPTWDEVPP